MRDNVFPFHTSGFAEGLLHSENIGSDIELLLDKRCVIGAFPSRYEVVCFEDPAISVEAVGVVA